MRDDRLWLWREGTDREMTERLAQEMLAGDAILLRTYIRMCNALLSGSGTIAAAAMQRASDAAAFGASSTCGVNMTMVMVEAR